jgi:hypothetical protein
MNMTIFYIILIVLFLFTYFSKAKPFIAMFLAVMDFIKMDKKKFRGYGFWLFCGLGGSGKTLSMVDYLNRMKKKYPSVKIYTNFNYKYADGKIDSWEDLIHLDNGVDGIIFGFDEIHLTFASQDWANCPTNMLDYISQQRKLHKQIVATSQVFTRIDKKLREQTNYVVECNSILMGRWVFNRAFHTDEYLANDEKGDKGTRKRNRAWRRNFIAFDRIRESYDTMQIMKQLESGKSKLQQKREDLLNLLDIEI